MLPRSEQARQEQDVLQPRGINLQAGARQQQPSACMQLHTYRYATATPPTRGGLHRPLAVQRLPVIHNSPLPYASEPTPAALRRSKTM